MEYQLQRVINNNAIVASDLRKQEVILLGKGIGVNWHHHKGDYVPVEMIEKIFVLQKDMQLPYFEEILKSIPLDYIEVVNKAIHLAEEELQCDFKDQLFLTLLDHIRFAKERFDNKEIVVNPLVDEIRQFHSKEFQAASNVIALLNKELDVRFDENEAGFITFHFINTLSPMKQSESLHILKISAKVITIIEESFASKVDKDSVYYHRLMTHLKYFLNRVFARPDRNIEERRIDVFTDIQHQYEREWICAQRIKRFLETEYHVRVTNEELNYLTIHIIQIVK